MGSLRAFSCSLDPRVAFSGRCYLFAYNVFRVKKYNSPAEMSVEARFSKRSEGVLLMEGKKFLVEGKK